MHSKQPCRSGKDALSVAKDIARPTLHQIAEWPEQTTASLHQLTLQKRNKPFFEKH
ncbi:hypothetical protein EMIT0P294_50199 [Pseudomonas sp. IT-P294]